MMPAPPPALIAQAPIARPRFAPPLARELAYRTVEHHPLSRGGEAVITSRRRLRLDRDPAGRLVATLILDAVDVDAAPAPQRVIGTAARALLGVPVTVVVAADGSPAAVLDPARAFAAQEAAFDAQARDVAAIPGIDPGERDAAITGIAAERARPVVEREARLRETLAPLLPPPLPALAPGEARVLTTGLPTPGGEVTATGTVRLDAAPPATLRYVTTIASDAAAGARAAAILRARVPATARAGQRARIGGQADALAGAVFHEESELELDRATGLVTALHERQGARSAAGDRLIVDRTITLESLR